MIKQVFIILVYLLDYVSGRAFYIISYLIGKNRRLISSIAKPIYPLSPCFLELHYLREEVRRLKFANSTMRAELNRVTQKKLCLCKKLQIIYFKLSFGISLRRIHQYLPISKTAVINYLNQLHSGISNLASRIRHYHNAPNRTPVSIGLLVWEFHRDNPHWGRWKIALAIWKVGVYVSPSTVRNILNSPKPDYHRPKKKDERVKMKSINGKYPNHTCPSVRRVWSIDLTTVYIFLRPLYILAILDHYSRKVMTLTTTFHPTADWVIRNIQEMTQSYGKPKHLISDYGTQFTAGNFKGYIEKQGVYHRYAKVSKANGNSKVERFFRSLKYELLNLYLFFSKAKVDRLLKEYLVYYNEHRPHEALDGQMPDEVYLHKPRDKPPKEAKIIKGTIERISFGDGLLKAYRLKNVA